jgi:DMSO reductase family type II enzyme heme b subunit
MACRALSRLALVLVPALVAAGARAAGDAAAGEPVYQKYCSQCHGASGLADGPAAAFVLPRPRVFKDNSTYKFRTTASGELPTEEDMLGVITRGIPGTSMPGFPRLSDAERWNLVAYLRSLSADFTDPDYTKSAVPMPELSGAEAPEPTAESVARGKQVYADSKCWQCHGQQGRGDGPSWPDLKDEWLGKTPILPANLSEPELFRGGSTTTDIFRAFSTGLNGTPMPSYTDLTTEQRWDLANYVRSLGPPAGRPKEEVVRAVRVAALPTGADDPKWLELPQARFPTLPQVIEPPRLYWQAVGHVMVRAAYTDTEVALLVEWDDRSRSTGTNTTTEYSDRDGTVYTATDHPDQIAIQFPAKFDPTRADAARVRPYFLMGDSKRAVSLWWWRSDEPDRITEVNAKGYGAFTTQPAESQGLSGGVTHADGRYALHVRRTLTTGDPKGDVQLATGAFVPLAFHAWDGARGELGQRRAVTTWYWLYLEQPVPPTATTYPILAFLGSFVVLVAVVIAARRRAGSPAATAAGTAA